MFSLAYKPNLTPSNSTSLYSYPFSLSSTFSPFLFTLIVPFTSLFSNLTSNNIPYSLSLINFESSPMVNF